jgi:SPP1 gp7 family putative phage head morphogenesis protein
LDKIGITDNNKYYLETVIRTNQITAMSAGDRVASIQNPDVEYYQYVAILDPRTTDVCKSLEGKILKKNDELWTTHLPPNHFNCRSRVITFSKGLAEQLNLKESSKSGIENPDENFAVDPSKTWSMPTKDMRQRLADHLGVDYKEIAKGAKFED